MAKANHGTMEGPDSHGFPAAGVDLIKHEVRVNLFQIMKDKEYRLETLVFNGRMVIERGQPYKNKEGVSQIDFIVKSWVATAWSRALKQELLYILSTDVDQPISEIIAQQKGSDFPASIQFNVIFDARANNRLIKQRHHGRPAAKNFLSIPPAENGDIKLAPTMTTFGDDDIIDVVVSFGPGGLQFVPADEKASSKVLHLRIKPLDCHDNEGRTVLTFVDLDLPPGLPPELRQMITEIPNPKDPRITGK